MTPFHFSNKAPSSPCTHPSKLPNHHIDPTPVSSDALRCFRFVHPLPLAARPGSLHVLLRGGISCARAHIRVCCYVITAKLTYETVVLGAHETVV